MTVPELTPYYLTLLKTNPEYVPPEDNPKALLHEHLAYGRKLFEAGKMMMSGPMAIRPFRPMPSSPSFVPGICQNKRSKIGQRASLDDDCQPIAIHTAYKP